MARAAWGLLLEGPHGASDHSGPVDAAQTAQRAELTAAVQTVSLAGAPVEVITDSRFVRNGVAALRAGACYLDWAHSDLWERIAEHSRSGFLTARWVKGHTTAEEALARGLSEEDRAGNAATQPTGWQAQRPKPGSPRQRSAWNATSS